MLSRDRRDCEQIGDTSGRLQGGLRFQSSAGVSPDFFTVP